MLMVARYKLKLSPSEFWAMTLVEFITELAWLDYHQNDPELAGDLSRADVDELSALLDQYSEETA